MSYRIIKDSSIWQSPVFNKLTAETGDIKVGIVREVKYSSDFDTTFYNVEVTSGGRRFTMSCTPMSRFGDVYNYEEWSFRGQNLKTPTPTPPGYLNRVGEVVIVAPLDANYLEGVILGGLKHPGRPSKIKSGISYISEFNGLETTIADTGAYKITFKGTPVTAAALPALVPGATIAPPTYNPAITGSYLTFTSNGSFEVNDAMLQSIKLNKPTGKMIFTSGAVTMELSKLDQKYTLYCKTSEISALKSWSMTTPGNASMFALKTMKIASPKIAIGFGSIELIDTIIKLVDAMGAVVINSPIGPCNPFVTAPAWTAVNLLKAKLIVIRGKL